MIKLLLVAKNLVMMCILGILSYGVYRILFDQAQPTDFDQLFQTCLPCLWRAGVCVRNLRLLCWTTQAVVGPVWVRLALVNPR